MEEKEHKLSIEEDFKHIADDFQYVSIGVVICAVCLILCKSINNLQKNLASASDEPKSSEYRSYGTVSM